MVGNGAKGHVIMTDYKTLLFCEILSTKNLRHSKDVQSKRDGTNKNKTFYIFLLNSQNSFCLLWENEYLYSFMLMIVLYQKIFVVCTHEAWSIALEIWYVWAYQVILHWKPTLRVVHNTSFKVVLIEVLWNISLKRFCL